MGLLLCPVACDAREEIALHISKGGAACVQTQRPLPEKPGRLQQSLIADSCYPKSQLGQRRKAGKQAIAKKLARWTRFLCF
jgi:hypothetical protein